MTTQFATLWARGEKGRYCQLWLDSLAAKQTTIMLNEIEN